MMYKHRSEILLNIPQRQALCAKSGLLEIPRAVRHYYIYQSWAADGEDSRSQLENTCGRERVGSWDVVNIPALICMRSPSPPWKDGSRSWFRKCFCPGLGSPAENRRIPPRFLIRTHMKKIKKGSSGKGPPCPRNWCWSVLVLFYVPVNLKRNRFELDQHLVEEPAPFHAFANVKTFK